MARGWSQVNLDRWVLHEHVDPEVHASQFVIAHIWSNPEKSGSWQWRVEVSDNKSSNDIDAGQTATEQEARRHAETTMDEALLKLRQGPGSTSSTAR